MATHRILMDNYRVPLIGSLIGRHRMAAAKKKKKETEVIGGEVLKAQVPRARGPRRVSITITLHKGRSPDADNVRKILLDGLVASGALVDDGPAWCLEVPVVFRRGKRRQCEIILEDVPVDVV
jgi:Holliday junction resolvase RusA-like endonuclease